MSNVPVQEALKSIELAEETGSIQYLLDALNQCKAALFEIEKCEPVAYTDGKDDFMTVKTYNEYVANKFFNNCTIPLCRCDTSPQPRDWVVPSNDVIDTLWHKATHESVAHSEPFTRYRFSELLIKQLNTKG